MANILDVVQGIAQIAQANAYDGATDSEGKPMKAGLRRERELDITDPRLIDGFKVKFSGDQMILVYQAEILIEEVHQPGFEGEVKQTLSDILAFIKREYKKLMKKELSITRNGEPDIQVQNLSRIRTILTATQAFNLKSTEAEGVVDIETPNEKLDRAIKTFMGYGKKKFANITKPSNVTRRESSND